MPKLLLAFISVLISLLVHIVLFSFSEIYFEIEGPDQKPSFHFIGQILQPHDLQSAERIPNKILSRKAQYAPDLKKQLEQKPEKATTLFKPPTKGAIVNIEKRLLKQDIEDDFRIKIPVEPMEQTPNLDITLPEIQYKPLNLGDDR